MDGLPSPKNHPRTGETHRENTFPIDFLIVNRSERRRREIDQLTAGLRLEALATWHSSASHAYLDLTEVMRVIAPIRDANHQQFCGTAGSDNKAAAA